MCINMRFFPLILIIILPAVLVSIWFKDANIMATGESGVPFYDPSLQFNINKDAWAKYTLGHPTNIGVAAKPTYFSLSVGQTIGIPTFLLQAVFFWLMSFVAGISIYFLTREFFPNLPKHVVLLAPLFYWFNPFSLVNIWNRFLNNFIVFYALLPLSLLLFIKGMHSKKYIFALFIGLTSAIFSYAQTSIAFNMLFWLVLSFITLFYLIFERKGNRVFLIKFFILTLIFWTLVNFWWIGQVFSYIGTGSFSQVSSTSFNTSDNHHIFFQISQRLGDVGNLLRLKHATFFADAEKITWIGIYQFPLIIFLEFLVAAIILLPIILIKKQQEVLFLTALFLLAVFFAKGNNPPMGEIFDRLFINLSFLQVLRNPFEKIGFILPLSAAPLFALGIFLILEKLRNNYKKLVYLITFVWLTLVWGGPFWTGLVFTSTEVPTNVAEVGYQVKVPDYYKEAAQWLNSRNEDVRLIALPLGGEGITYKWEKGYSGVELTNQLLPQPAVSFNTNIPFYDAISKNMEKLFLTTNSLTPLSNALNAKYILYRSDINWEVRKMRDPLNILSVLEKKQQNKELKKVAQFGELSLWQILSKNKGKIYPSTSTLLSYSRPDISDLEFSQNNLVINPGSEISGIRHDLIEGEVIHPQARFFLDHPVEPVFEIRQDIFPHVSILPKEFIYPLVVIKDVLEEKTIRDREKLLDFRLRILGKRLVEARLSAKINLEKDVHTALDNYRELFDRTLGLIEEFGKTDQGRRQASLQPDLYLLFERHVKVLEDLIGQFGDSSQTGGEAASLLKTLKSGLVRTDIFPYYDFIIDDDFPIERRIVFRFEVLQPGEFELLWDEKILDGFYKLSEGDEIVFQKDNELLTRKIETDGKGHVSFGKIYFDKGIHEIGLNQPEGINLVDSLASLSFQVDHGSKVYPLAVTNYDPYSSYSIYFDYWLKRGSGVQVSVYNKGIDDINPVASPSAKFIVGPDFYDFAPKNLFKSFRLDEGADQATILLEVLPWNNCETIFYTKRKERCKSEAFRRPYDKTTEIDISNIKVSRDFTDLPILVRKDLSKVVSLPDVEFKKIEPTTYQIDIKNAKEPFFLILSELFDPGWKLLSLDGSDMGFQHFLANSFSNSWYIEKKGDYQLMLKFAPQQWLSFGEKLSIFAALSGAIFVAYKVVRRKHADSH